MRVENTHAFLPVIKPVASSDDDHELKYSFLQTRHFRTGGRVKTRKFSSLSSLRRKPSKDMYEYYDETKQQWSDLPFNEFLRGPKCTLMDPHWIRDELYRSSNRWSRCPRIPDGEDSPRCTEYVVTLCNGKITVDSATMHQLFEMSEYFQSVMTSAEEWECPRLNDPRITMLVFDYLVCIVLGLDDAKHKLWVKNSSQEEVSKLLDDVAYAEKTLAGRNLFGTHVAEYICQGKYRECYNKREWPKATAPILFAFDDEIVEVERHIVKTLTDASPLFHNLIHAESEHILYLYRLRNVDAHIFKLVVFMNHPHRDSILQRSEENALSLFLSRTADCVNGTCAKVVKLEEKMFEGCTKAAQYVQVEVNRRKSVQHFKWEDDSRPNFYCEFLDEPKSSEASYEASATPTTGAEMLDNMQRIELRDPSNQELIMLAEHNWTLLSSKEENGQRVQVLGRYYQSRSHR